MSKFYNVAKSFGIIATVFAIIAWAVYGFYWMYPVTIILAIFARIACDHQQRVNAYYEGVEYDQ